MLADSDCAEPSGGYVLSAGGVLAGHRAPGTRTPESRSVLPPALHQLLHGANAAARESAWESLLAEQSRLLLHVAHSFATEHDGAMDAYAYVLDRLREDDYRRLRGYEADGRSRFSTWLVVVARRLCLDFHRHRYGRVRDGARDEDSVEAAHAARRRLVDLAAAAIDLASLAHDEDEAPDRGVRSTQLREALQSALDELAPDDRLILKLRFEDDLTAQQIATVLQWPTPFHVFRRLNAVFARLKRGLLARGVESSVP